MVMQASAMGLERLDAWQMSREYALRIYREVLPALPAEERWGLNSQLRRASTSIAANIAEGHGRYYYLESIRFCYNARGSLEEVGSHLSIARDLGMIPEALYGSLEDDALRLIKCINGYIAYLRKSKQGESEAGTPYRAREGQARYEFELEEQPDA